MRVRQIRPLCLGVAVSLLVPVASWAAEGRIPVFAPGTVIASPGKYIVTRNLTQNGAAPVITIAAQNVELDLNGFLLEHGGGGTGILVNDPSDVLIRNGNFQSVSVGIDATSIAAERLVVEDVRIYLAAVAGIRAANVNNVIVRRALIYRSFGDGIRITGLGTTGEISDSQIKSVTDQAIEVLGGDSFAVLRNKINGSFQEGIRIDSCRGCRIESNSVTHGGGPAAINLTSVLEGSVTNNSAAQSTNVGIRLGPGCEALLVRSNVVSDSGSHGLLVEGALLKIEDNVLTGNDGFGLRFTAGSSYCTFGRNMARNNGGGAGPCAGPPALFPPESCNDGIVNFSFGDNLIPGPALF